eukprot:1275835-Pleurochrysis_carterae.AAC.1
MDLDANFAIGGDNSIKSVLHAGATTARAASASSTDAYAYSTTATLSARITSAASDNVEVVECDLCAGGDMAAAHAGWALDSPVAQYGCCFMCELKKQSWFDPKECGAARRRNLYRAYCAAHVTPVRKLNGIDPLAPPPRCPFCRAELSRAFEAKEFRRLEEATPAKAAELMRQHMKTHAGQALLSIPVQPLDHIDRAPSLLHHRINSAGMSIATTMAKASLAKKKALNEILKKYGQGWRFAETSNKRDQRPQGNDARALLTRKGLLFELLIKVYGEPQSAEQRSASDELNDAVHSSSNVRGNPITTPLPPTAASRATTGCVIILYT